MDLEPYEAEACQLLQDHGLVPYRHIGLRKKIGQALQKAYTAGVEAERAWDAADRYKCECGQMEKKLDALMEENVQLQNEIDSLVHKLTVIREQLG